MVFSDVGAEMAVIKCMLNGWTDEVTDGVELAYFQTEYGKEVIQKIWSLLHIGEVTTKILLDRYKENIAIQDYIIACNNVVVGKGEINHYITQLKTAYLKTRTKEYTDKLNRMAYSEEIELNELHAEVSNGLDIDIDNEQEPLFNIPENYASAHFQAYYARVQNPNQETGIQIKSLPRINKAIMGLKPGNLMMLAAQSGKGKTAMALNICRDFAIDQNHSVYYANAEMEEDDLTLRIASALSSVPATELYTGEHEGDKMDKVFKVSEAYDKIGKSGLIISSMPVMTMKKIRRGYKQLKNAGKTPDIIVIDYIGRMDYEGDTKGLSEWQILGKLSEQSKILAKQLNVVVIILAQLNDDNTLQGARKMINPCDVVMLFQEADDEDEKHMNQRQKDYCNYKMILSKVRRGNNDVVYMNFNKKIQKVSEIE